MCLLRHESLKLGKNFAKLANCSLVDMQCLLSLSPQAVLNAQIKSSNPAFHFSEISRLVLGFHRDHNEALVVFLRLKGGESLPLSGGV